MNQLYVSLIFLGIVLVLFSLIWIIYDRKRSYNYEKRLDEKKEELIGVIDDAGQMIEEMNKFSDYIVNQMDLKSEEMWNSLRMAERQVEVLNSSIQSSIQSIQETKPVSIKKVAGGEGIDENIKTEVRNHEKVIPLNSKYRNVVNLAERGMNSTDIAKQLNMGKGEVQLILELNR